MKRVSLPNIFLDIPIAHRGLHSDEVMENSLKSVVNACEKGFNIEIDLHITLDDVIVVCHDYSLKRLAGIDKNIDELTYKELSKIHLVDGSILPTLEEVLLLVNGKVGLCLEIKSKKILRLRIAKVLLKILKHYPYKDKIIIESYNPFLVRYLKMHTSEYAIGQLSSSYVTGINPFFRYLMATLKVCYFSHPDFISYNVMRLNNPYIRKWKNKGLIIFTWTIRNEITYIKSVPLADNIIFERVNIYDIIYKYTLKLENNLNSTMSRE